MMSALTEDARALRMRYSSSSGDMVQVRPGDVLLPADERWFLRERDRRERVGGTCVGVGIEREQFSVRTGARLGGCSHATLLPWS